MSHDEEQDDDSDLFRQAVEGVRPLKDQPRVSPHRKNIAPRPLQRELDEEAVMQELLLEPPREEGLETGEELLFLRPGFQKRYLKRLRRGHYAVADHLDLHGMNEDAAGKILRQFIDQSAVRGMGCIRVVHGKGLRSKGPPKLKLLTRRLLKRHPDVVAFLSCRPVDGGTGAVLILLKTNR